MIPNNVGVHLFVQNQVIRLVILFFIIRPHLTSPTQRLGTSCFWALAVCISVHLIDCIKDLSCIHHTDVHSPEKSQKQLKICVRFVVSVVSVQIKVQHLRSGRMCRFQGFIDICCMLWLLYSFSQAYPVQSCLWSGACPREGHTWTGCPSLAGLTQTAICTPHLWAM